MTAIIEIYREPVELYKVLKFQGLVSSGGEAKHVIERGLVSVNGRIEQRKRCKLKAGDHIEFQSQQFKLTLREVCTADQTGQ